MSNWNFFASHNLRVMSNAHKRVTGLRYLHKDRCAVSLDGPSVQVPSPICHTPIPMRDAAASALSPAKGNQIRHKRLLFIS
jgi:hypothetical protein